ncbi:MAG: 50S ribosomal protein L18 [Rhodospirillales bacterium]|nr:50S ribosomal protein L18 [Rhodospirillales bacterium]
MKNARDLHARRSGRIRRKVKAGQNGKPRLSVFRSGKHIYAQVIDDGAGHTMAQASSLDSGVRGDSPTGANIDAAAKVGKAIAEKATAAGVTEVVFDRGGCRYHGRVKALADAAREGGLKF